MLDKYETRIDYFCESYLAFLFVNELFPGMKARPALLRSRVVFKVPPIILERHFLRFKTIRADSHCRHTLRLPLPLAARVF